MARKGLWKLNSGRFAGWRDGDQLYDAQGCHVGYFKSDVGYNTEGDYLAEIYRDDWIGKKHGATHPAGNVSCSLESILAAPLPDREGLGVDGWHDPDF